MTQSDYTDVPFLLQEFKSYDKLGEILENQARSCH